MTPPFHLLAGTALFYAAFVGTPAAAQDAAPVTPAPTPAPTQSSPPVRITPPIAYSLPSGDGQSSLTSPPRAVTPVPVPDPVPVPPVAIQEPARPPERRETPSPAPRRPPVTVTQTARPVQPVEVAPDPVPAVPDPVETETRSQQPDTPVALPTGDAAPEPTETVREPAQGGGGEEGSGWHWLVGLGLALALGAGAAWLLRRGRAARVRQDVAEPPEPVPAEPAVPAPEPVPAPKPAPAPAMLAPAAARSSPPLQPRSPVIAPPTAAPTPDVAGIELQVIPHRAGMTAIEGLVDFSILVTNRSAARAENMLLSAFLLTAHGDQDAELAERFAAPLDPRSHNPFALASGESRRFDAGLTIPRAMIHSITVGGQRVFVPIVAASLRYRSGLTTGKRATAAFMIGRSRPGQERLAPLPLDGDPRLFTDVAARLHQHHVPDLRLAS